jgi:hypothetical protein
MRKLAVELPGRSASVDRRCGDQREDRQKGDQDCKHADLRELHLERARVVEILGEFIVTVC